jgi:hypothetical protein
MSVGEKQVLNGLVSTHRIKTFYNKMFFLGLSGFWTEAQNKENKNLLFSVR